jgi:hypothetical protein
VRRVRDPNRAPPPPPDLTAPACPSSSKPRSGIPSEPSLHPAWSHLPSCGVRRDRRRLLPCRFPRHATMPELRGFEDDDDLLDEEGPLSAHAATLVALSTPLHTSATAGSPSTSVPLPAVLGPTSPPWEPGGAHLPSPRWRAPSTQGSPPRAAAEISWGTRMARRSWTCRLRVLADALPSVFTSGQLPRR